jgi:microcystin-dependent protein
VGTRIKTFDSTGVAPNGRLFAGDLNLMQDQYADQSNFSQTVDVGTLRVGDSTLQLLKFGASEFRMSGALRVDGILRGLGGLYAGAFTTTQRDAIALGSRPYGLVILNTTTNQYEWNSGTDATPSWVPLGSITSAGTLGARPSATVANAGQLYFATDDNGGTMYRSNGSAWVRVTIGLTHISRGNLGSRPAANTVPSGNIYIATDDHGGTSYESDGTSWTKMGGSINGEVAIGAVMDWPYGSAQVPTQDLLPYGQAVLRSAYPELHALASAAGYPHGAGDGSTTFNLPDYRGKVGAGKDDMGGTAANRITAAISGIAGITLGASGGAEGITLTTGQIPAHAHTDSGHTHVYSRASASGGSTGAGAGGVLDTLTNTNDGLGFAQIQNTGGGGAHANVQPTIIVNKIMRAL